jgi:hypothetical protein
MDNRCEESGHDDVEPDVAGQVLTELRARRCVVSVVDVMDSIGSDDLTSVIAALAKLEMTGRVLRPCPGRYQASE